MADSESRPVGASAAAMPASSAVPAFLEGQLPTSVELWQTSQAVNESLRAQVTFLQCMSCQHLAKLGPSAEAGRGYHQKSAWCVSIADQPGTDGCLGNQASTAIKEECRAERSCRVPHMKQGIQGGKEWCGWCCRSQLPPPRQAGVHACHALPSMGPIRLANSSLRARCASGKNCGLVLFRSAHRIMQAP